MAVTVRARFLRIVQEPRMSADRVPLLLVGLLATTIVGLVATEGVASASAAGVTSKQCTTGGGKVTGTTCSGGTYDKRSISNPAPTGLYGNPAWWPKVYTDSSPTHR